MRAMLIWRVRETDHDLMFRFLGEGVFASELGVHGMRQVASRPAAMWRYIGAVGCNI
jgi:hypothetical protein